MPEIVVRDRAKAPDWLNDKSLQLRLGVLVWLVPFLVISVLVAMNPPHRNVTPLYHEASENWWAGKDLYRGPGGMNYLPEFPLIFSPFHSLPVPVGDILWRFCMAALLATGLWRFLREQCRDDIAEAFLYASLLTMPL